LFILINERLKINKSLKQHDIKEFQVLTGGIFYCRDSAGFSVSAFNKLSWNLTGQCFEIGNKNIPRTVTSKRKKTEPTVEN